MIFARRSRSASAWRAIACCIRSGISTSLISTLVTLIPHGSVWASITSCSDSLRCSRLDSSVSRSATPRIERSVVWAICSVASGKSSISVTAFFPVPHRSERGREHLDAGSRCPHIARHDHFRTHRCVERLGGTGARRLRDIDVHCPATLDHVVASRFCRRFALRLLRVRDHVYSTPVCGIRSPSSPLFPRALRDPRPPAVASGTNRRFARAHLWFPVSSLLGASLPAWLCSEVLQRFSSCSRTGGTLLRCSPTRFAPLSWLLSSADSFSSARSSIRCSVPDTSTECRNFPANLALLHGDLLAAFVPGYFQWFSVHNLLAGYQINSAAMYLGIPFILTVGLVVVLLRRRGIVVMAGVLAASSFVLSLGSTLYVGGHDTQVPLPFAVVAHVPIIDGLLSTRFALYTALFGAAVVAMGLDALHARLASSSVSSGRSRRTGVIGVAVTLALAVVVSVPLLPGAHAAGVPDEDFGLSSARPLLSMTCHREARSLPIPTRAHRCFRATHWASRTLRGTRPSTTPSSTRLSQG